MKHVCRAFAVCYFVQATSRQQARDRPVSIGGWEHDKDKYLAQDDDLADGLRADRAAGGGRGFVFSITEGVTYYQTNREIQSRFQPLADLLSKALKRPVRMVVVSPYNDVREGLAKQEYDLAFIHPAHVSLAAIKSGQYHSVAWTSGFIDYSVYLLINKDQVYTKFDDLKGHTIVSPDPDSITAAMLRAMLRDQKLTSTDVKVITTRYQDAVPFYVEYGFARRAPRPPRQWPNHGPPRAARYC